MYWFIVNPVSGNKRGQEIWQYVKKELDWYQIPYQVTFTQQPEHAIKITRQIISEPDLKAVIAIGGDGTVHEVGNALVQTNIPLGYIPAGTGNDFALAHRISFDPVYALQRILLHQPRLIDTAFLGDRYMISFSGFGFDAQVAKKVTQLHRYKWLGRMTYALGVIQVVKSFQPTTISLTVDGEQYRYDQVWFVAIVNTSNYAGGMEICPQAKVDDGILDICCVRCITPIQLLTMLPLVYRGKHTKHPSIITHRGKEIFISSNSDQPIHVDGEMVGTSALTIRVNPKSLLIL